MVVSNQTKYSNAADNTGQGGGKEFSVIPSVITGVAKLYSEIAEDLSGVQSGVGNPYPSHKGDG